MSTIPFAKAGQLLAADEVQVIAPAIASYVTRFAPTVDIAPVGTALVLRVQDISGGSPTGYIQATIAAGAKVATPATGSFAVAAGATIYVRVVSGPTAGNAASYVAGYFETTAPEAATGSFCTLAQLKAAAGITVTTYDADLTLIIQTVTAAMQAYMARDIVSTAYTGEKHSLAYATGKLVLNHRPIISVQAVREDGSVVASGSYVAVLGEGILYNEGGWAAGTYHLEADYTAGYASVPAALVGACINQSRYQWSLRAPAGGGRFGEAQRAEASGGSTAFIVEDWYPGVLDVLKSYRRLA